MSSITQLNSGGAASEWFGVKSGGDVVTGMCAHMHTPMHMHARVHTHAHAHTHTHTHERTHVQAHARIQTRTRTTHMQLCACTRKYTHSHNAHSPHLLQYNQQPSKVLEKPYKLFFYCRAVCPSDAPFSAGTFQAEVYGYLAGVAATRVATFGMWFYRSSICETYFTHIYSHSLCFLFCFIVHKRTRAHTHTPTYVLFTLFRGRQGDLTPIKLTSIINQLKTNNLYIISSFFFFCCSCAHTAR